MTYNTICHGLLVLYNVCNPIELQFTWMIELSNQNYKSKM